MKNIIHQWSIYEKGKKKCLPNHTSDKELITKTYRKDPTTTIKNAIEKMRERTWIHISPDKINKKGNRYMTRSPSLVIRGMQIQTTMRYHLTCENSNHKR